MRLIAKWIIVAIAFLALPRIVPGVSVTASFWTVLIIALLWGIIQSTIRPLIMLVLLPLNLITLGLFSLVVNALLFWGLGIIVEGFAVAGFVPAFLGALAISLVSMIADSLLKGKEE